MIAGADPRDKLHQISAIVSDRLGTGGDALSLYHVRSEARRGQQWIREVRRIVIDPTLDDEAAGLGPSHDHIAIALWQPRVGLRVVESADVGEQPPAFSAARMLRGESQLALLDVAGVAVVHSVMLRR